MDVIAGARRVTAKVRGVRPRWDRLALDHNEHHQERRWQPQTLASKIWTDPTATNAKTILQPCSPTAILLWERTVGLRRTELARSGLFAGHAPSPMATGCLLWLPSG